MAAAAVNVAIVLFRRPSFLDGRQLAAAAVISAVLRYLRLSVLSAQPFSTDGLKVPSLLFHRFSGSCALPLVDAIVTVTVVWTHYSNVLQVIYRLSSPRFC